MILSGAKDMTLMSQASLYLHISSQHKASMEHSRKKHEHFNRNTATESRLWLSLHAQSLWKYWMHSHGTVGAKTLICSCHFELGKVLDCF